MLGHSDFTLEWVSVYKFQCRRLAAFVHDRVYSPATAAHQVSPFGARGANSGIQDADNLGWKLARVMQGKSPARLIESYDDERGQAADENIRHSTRSTDFIAPRTTAERNFRDAALLLAGHADFAKRFVNSGRLSLPTTYETALSTAGQQAGGGVQRIGAPALDLPLGGTDGHAWLLGRLGARFAVLHIGSEPPPAARADGDIDHISVPFDTGGIVARRYGSRAGTVYVVRPDQHVCASFERYEPARVAAAIDRAGGN